MYIIVLCGATSILKIFTTQKKRIDILFLYQGRLFAFLKLYSSINCFGFKLYDKGFSSLWEIFKVIGNQKNYQYFDRSFRKVLNVVGRTISPASNAKNLGKFRSKLPEGPQYSR